MEWSGARESERMLERHVGSTLSAHRAFVVHLGAGGPGRRRVSGRVEHLASGRTAHFASFKELLAFFAAILDAPAPAALHGVTDGHPTDTPVERVRSGPARDARPGDRAPRSPVTERRGESTTAARGRSTTRPAPSRQPPTHTERSAEP